MATRYSFTRTSSNSKTGPLPVTMTTSNSCPDSCPLKGQGCYARFSFVGIQWRKLDANLKALNAEGLAAKIKTLSKGQLWRHNIAGDLAHNDGTIDKQALDTIVKANKGRAGFTYTHHDMSSKENRASIEEANRQGFTVNLSANSPDHADQLAELNIGPVVTLLPEEYTSKTSKTPAGRPIVVCPAVTTEGISCATCGLCAKVDRKSIVGFPAHGTAKKMTEKTIMIHTRKAHE